MCKLYGGALVSKHQTNQSSSKIQENQNEIHEPNSNFIYFREGIQLQLSVKFNETILQKHEKAVSTIYPLAPSMNVGQLIHPCLQMKIGLSQANVSQQRGHVGSIFQNLYSSMEIMILIAKKYMLLGEVKSWTFMIKKTQNRYHRGIFNDWWAVLETLN